MFGENHKISGRQLERLLVLDWVGKAGLLLPRFSGRAGGRSFLFSLLLGILLTLGYTWCVRRLAEKVENDFYGYLCYRLGRPTAVFVSLLYWMYAFVNTLFLLRLFAEIAVTFVLPETQPWVLMVLAAFCGVYAADGGLEVRARFSEVLYPLVIYPLILLLLFAVPSMRADYVVPQYTALSAETVCHGLQMFTAFGGVGLYLYLAPAIDNQKKAGKSLLRSVSVTLAGEFVLFLIIIGTFGEQGMKALPFPLVTLMSSVEIPGGFLQRWDVIFTVLLLAGFFAAITAGMYYLEFLAREIFGGKKRRANLFVPAAAVTAAACSCARYELAIRLYTMLNGCVFLPIAIFFTILLLFLEMISNRKGKTGENRGKNRGRNKGSDKEGRIVKRRMTKAVLLAGNLAVLAFLLTGCGRELEDREFPSVLVVARQDLKEALLEAQEESGKYLDYGQVKAVVIQKEIAENEEALRDILLCLEQNPVFARNILFFAGNARVLHIAEQKADSEGDTLEDFYKNTPARSKQDGITLGEMLDYLHNGDREIHIPYLEEKEGRLVLAGSVKLEKEAYRAENFPSWKTGQSE